MADSPTKRSLDLLRQCDYRVDVVERFNSFIKKRFDFCGFADLIAYRPLWGRDLKSLATVGGMIGGSSDPDDRVKLTGCLAIQATSGDNLMARLAKVTEGDLGEVVADWLHCGNRLECWGWVKKGKRGKRKLWTLNVRRVLYASGKFWYAENSEVELFGYNPVREEAA